MRQVKNSIVAAAYLIYVMKGIVGAAINSSPLLYA